MATRFLLISLGIVIWGNALAEPFVSAARAEDKNAILPIQSDWEFDQIELTSGGTLQGLIVNDEPHRDLEVIEVRRPPGKPMYLVVLPIDRAKVKSIRRLTDADRARLRKRLDKFIHRAAIESRRMDDITLPFEMREDVKTWQYQGNGFWLESTADEETTQRAAVRIEQIFSAYRQILPPRRTSKRRLKILLFGSEEQYASFLRGLGLEIANPAFFAADFNVVAAGSNVSRFMQNLQTVRAEHKKTRKQLDAQWKEMPTRLAAFGEQLRKSGIPENERKIVISAEQRTWQERRQRLTDEIARADRRNASKLDQVTQEMFARLNHEAFHAYLDNYVFPHQDFDVPRWLNEGLALTFESGQIDAGTLRIDAPNRSALQALQTDLNSGAPLNLAELLIADPEAFLPAHRGGAGKAARLYAYSWGLAYYLTFEKSLLDSDNFSEFIAPSENQESPIARFEKFVGMPLDEFEREWRTAILKL
jgi:hypothetical protein